MTFWEKVTEFFRRHRWFREALLSFLEYFGGAYLGAIVALHLLGLC